MGLKMEEGRMLVSRFFWRSQTICVLGIEIAYEDVPFSKNP